MLDLIIEGTAKIKSEENRWIAENVYAEGEEENDRERSSWFEPARRKDGLSLPNPNTIRMSGWITLEKECVRKSIRARRK